MKNSSLFIFLSLSLLLVTCTKDSYNPDVCFSKNVLPIFVSNCTMSGCHNSADHKAGLDLSNYDGIMNGVTPKHPLFSSVYNSVSGNNPSMPPRKYPKLNSLEVSYIKIWINMGAQNTTNCGGSSCDTTNVTYSGRISSIMQAWCVGCHNANSAGGGINLSDYAHISKPEVIGRIVGSIKQSSGYSAMPKGGNQLTSCDIAAVEKWINNGYPNN